MTHKIGCRGVVPSQRMQISDSKTVGRLKSLTKCCQVISVEAVPEVEVFIKIIWVFELVPSRDHNQKR